MPDLDPLSAGSILGIDQPTPAVKWLSLLHNLTGGALGPGLPTLINELETNRLNSLKQTISQGFLTAYGAPGTTQTGAGAPSAGSGQEVLPDALLRSQTGAAVPSLSSEQVSTAMTSAKPGAKKATVKDVPGTVQETGQASPQAALLQALLQPQFQPAPDGVDPRAWMYGQILGHQQRMKEVAQGVQLLKVMGGVGQLKPEFLLGYEQRERHFEEREKSQQEQSDRRWQEFLMSQESMFTRLGITQKNLENRLDQAEYNRRRDALLKRQPTGSAFEGFTEGIGATAKNKQFDRDRLQLELESRKDTLTGQPMSSDEWKQREFQYNQTYNEDLSGKKITQKDPVINPATGTRWWPGMTVKPATPPKAGPPGYPMANP